MYSLVKIPVFAEKRFFDFTTEEAKKYFQWFLSIKDERIKILEAHVQLLYSGWKSDYTQASLTDLYQWFKVNVAYRAMNNEEKKAVEKQISATPLLADIIPIPEVTFTDETVTICFDIGLYLGDTLIKHSELLKWAYVMKPARYVHFAQPILVKKGAKVDFNPRSSIEALARELLNNDPKPSSFSSLFDAWRKTFSK